MNFTEDILSQLKNVPDWVLIMVGLTVLGIYWKKSQLPNRALKYLNLILPTVAYPILHYSAPEAAQQYWNPWLVLGVHGLGIGLLSEFCHEGIVAKLKIIFPSLKFPAENEETKPDEPAKPETKI